MAKTKVREILASDDTRKEKLDYLWEYYRWHAILTVLGIVFGSYLLVDWINRPITVFHVTVFAPEVFLVEEEPLTSDLHDLLQPEGPNDTVYASFTGEGQGQLAERFTAQLTAGEYDIILMDEPTFEDYSQYGGMQMFRLSELDEDAYYQTEEYSAPMAIDSSHLDVFDSYETTQDKIVMIPQNTRRREAIDTFFESQGYAIEFIDQQ